MKQAVKATALLLLVSLLSGCSSAEAKACKAATEAYSKYRKIGDENINKIPTSGYLGKYQKIALDAYLYANKIVINNQKCFTPEQVVSAQLAVG
jgi:hypothetical protein